MINANLIQAADIADDHPNSIRSGHDRLQKLLQDVQPNFDCTNRSHSSQHRRVKKTQNLELKRFDQSRIAKDCNGFDVINVHVQQFLHGKRLIIADHCSEFVGDNKTVGGIDQLVDSLDHYLNVYAVHNIEVLELIKLATKIPVA